jgi:hypothetical protein
MSKNAVVRCAGVILAVVGAACSNGQPFDGDGGASGGGHGGTGGKVGAGGTGGHLATGGQSGSAGSTAGHAGGAGGTGGAGGNVGTGGLLATGGGGGTAATGGTVGTGGSGTGGNLATGGSGGAGGKGGTGGSATGGAGGMPVVCGANQHNCGGTCVSNMATTSCGATRCDPCAAPAGGTATCDGTTCGFSCSGSTPKKCDTAGICIASSGCCSNTDCPTNAGGQTGTCDTGTHTCNYACTGTTKSCTSGGTTVCIPTSGCCTNSDCTGTCQTCDTGTHTCVAAKSMDDPTGRCVGTCDATGACKSKQGQTCNTTAGGCVSGTTCSPDGYCCDMACTGSCVACDLAGMQGKCTPIAKGAAPHGNRAACTSDGSSCGGSCDGAGACSYPTGSCGSASCSGTSSYSYTPAPTCNGAGKCVTMSSMSCGAYTCNGNSSCYTTCTSQSQCVAGDVCSGNMCQSCSGGKPACGNSCCGGSTPVCVANQCKQCGANADCTAIGYFQCTSSNTCACRSQSVSNLLVNGGFDGDLSGWFVNDNSTAKGYSTSDAEGCPGSGSLLVNGGRGDIEQCVQVTAGKSYNFGFKYKQSTATSFACYIDYYAGPTCLSVDLIDSSPRIDSSLVGATWQTYTSVVTVPAGAVGLMILCGSAGTANMDEFYVNPTGGF